MKTDPENPQPWSRLVERARRDAPPPIDLDALLRTTRAAHRAGVSAPNWIADFAALFCTPRVISACLALTFACVAAAAWQYQTQPEQSDPWAELVNATLEDLA